MNEVSNASEAILLLFEQHADGIYRYVSYLLPAYFDARDVVQEVFLRAYKSWDKFEGQSSEKTWLYKIARNCVYDLLRKKKSETNLINRYTSEVRNNSASLDSIIEYDELLRELPNPYRQVIVLRAVEGLSVAETARVLGITEATVRLQFFRGKKKFEKLLARDTLDLNYEARGELHL